MTIKRNRTRTSSFCHVAANNTPGKVMRTEDGGDNAGESSRQPILTIGPPVSGAPRSDHSKIGGFLDACHYCKKRIAPNSEIFMYSTFRAFCTRECRDQQIAEDEKQSKNKK